MEMKGKRGEEKREKSFWRIFREDQLKDRSAWEIANRRFCRSLHTRPAEAKMGVRIKWAAKAVIADY